MPSNELRRPQERLALLIRRHVEATLGYRVSSDQQKGNRLREEFFKRGKDAKT